MEKPANGLYDETYVKNNKIQAAHQFAEGNPELENLLLSLYNHNIMTTACCAGHSDIEKFGYINIEIDRNNTDFINNLVTRMSTEENYDWLVSYNAVIEKKSIAFYAMDDNSEQFFKMINQTLMQTIYDKLDLPLNPIYDEVNALLYHYLPLNENDTHDFFMAGINKTEAGYLFHLEGHLSQHDNFKNILNLHDQKYIDAPHNIVELKDQDLDQIHHQLIELNDRFFALDRNTR